MTTRLLVSALLLLALAHGVASAEVLQLEGMPSMAVRKDATGAVSISGKFFVTNSGTETAFDVFPVFTLGQFSWGGDPRRIERGTTAEWSIETTAPVEKLSCSDDPSCASPSLPLYGVFPVLSRIHYRDVNGYSFTAPQLYRAEITDGSANLSGTLLGAKLFIEGDGQEFSGELEIRNNGDSAKRVSVAYFTAREILVQSRPVVVEAPPHGTATTEIALENFRALPGSRYPIFAIIQWEDDGFRNISWDYSIVTVEARDRRFEPLAAVLGVLILGLVLWLLRRSRKARA